MISTWILIFFNNPREIVFEDLLLIPMYNILSKIGKLFYYCWTNNIMIMYWWIVAGWFTCCWSGLYISLVFFNVCYIVLLVSWKKLIVVWVVLCLRLCQWSRYYFICHIVMLFYIWTINLLNDLVRCYFGCNSTNLRLNANFLFKRFHCI